MPFTPTDLAGLALWLDASTLALADGAPVLVWPDRSGRGLDLTALGAPPHLRTNVYNHRPAVRFNPALNEYLQRATTTVGAVAHVYAVAKYNAATFPSYNGLIGGNAEVILLGEGGSTSLYNVSNTPTYYYNGADSTASRKGPMNELAALGISFATPHPDLAPIIGSDRFNPGRYWDGDVAEVILYDRVLAPAERAQVDAYLAAKWIDPPVHYGRAELALTLTAAVAGRRVTFGATARPLTITFATAGRVAPSTVAHRPGHRTTTGAGSRSSSRPGQRGGRGGTVTILP